MLFLTPIGFVLGIGCFDYWGRYLIGAPTQPEDHADHGAYRWQDYFKVNTDHKVIGIQYLVTTFIFFLIGGLLRGGVPHRARQARACSSSPPSSTTA